MEKNVQAHVIVKGKIQGVFFRAETQKTAEQNHVRGWVRNCPDRTVEAVFQGGESDVRKVVAWCRKGPSRSLVEDVIVTFQEAGKGFEGFEIRY
jgi:acylphosphatase